MQRHASTLRRINAVLAALLVVFFFAHAFMGSFTQAFSPRPAPVPLIWCFIGVACAHIVLSFLTTYVMFTDTVRPPSPRKRAHQWLKWASGAALAIVAGIHMATGGTPANALLLVVLVILTWHACVGCKSLARDLGLGNAAKMALRVAVIAVACVIGIFASIAWLG